MIQRVDNAKTAGLEGMLMAPGLSFSMEAHRGPSAKTVAIAGQSIPDHILDADGSGEVRDVGAMVVDAERPRPLLSRDVAATVRRRLP